MALATVADLVPAGRREGAGGSPATALAALARLAARPGLRALIAVSRADPSALDAGTLGFRLAPRINAAGTAAQRRCGGSSCC